KIPDKQCANTIPITPQNDSSTVAPASRKRVIAFHRIEALTSPTATIISAVYVVIGVTIVEIANIRNNSTASPHPSPRKSETSQSAVAYIVIVTNIVTIAILVIRDNAALLKRSGSSLTLVNADCNTFITGGSNCDDGMVVSVLALL